MDPYGPMCVASVNEEKYILVIADDYSQFTWVKCLRLEDEALDLILKFLKMIQENAIVERCNCTLIEAARTILIYAKAPLFLWAKVDILFQPLFHELLTPPPSVDPRGLEVIVPITRVVALEPAASTGSPSSTTVVQDAPSPSNSQTTPETQSPVISNDVEEENHDLDVAHMNNDLFFGIPLPENDSKSSFSDVIPTVVHTTAPNLEHVTKWTKDHPLDNIISELERLVSTRLQLHEQALFCYYDAFLTSFDPKNYKDTLTQALAKLDDIRIFLVFAAYMNMIIYQIDVKMTLLNGILREEVYVSQPDKFVDHDNPNHVYKLKNALCGLKQAPRTWIFEKYGMKSSDPVDTPMVEKSKLDLDPQGKTVDPTHYHGMVGTHMYLIASRPDLTFVQKKYKKKADESVTSPKSKTASFSKGTGLKSKAKVDKPDKNKQPEKKTKAKGLAVLSEVALTEVKHIKLVTKRSKIDFYISQVSSLGDGVDTQSKVPDEQKTFGTNKGTGTIPGVPDVPPYKSKSDKESWGDSEDEDDNDDDGDNNDDGESDDQDNDNDNERIEFDNDEIFDPNLTNVDQNEYEEEDVDEEDDKVLKELYEDVNVNLEKGDAEMTDANQRESEMSELKKTGQFAKAVSSILGIVDKYLASKMKEAVNVAIQLQTKKLKEEAHHMVMLSYLKKDEKIKTKMKTPPLDKTEGRREGNLSVHGKEPSHTVEESAMQQDQEFVTRDNDEQPIDKEINKAVWFKKPERPPTLDPDWRTAFNLLKGTCKSITELEYHLKECSKATTERLDWHNPKNKPYPFDLRKPLSLIQDHRGRKIIPKDYFINKHLEYLKGRESSRRYLTSVTKTKAATYELKWIEDLVPKLWSPVVLTSLTIDERYDLNVALRMFTRRIVIQRRVKDLQLGVKSYQKKLKLTKPDKYRSNLRNKTTYTSQSDPHGIIYVDQSKRKKLMRTDELHKFSDGTLNDVRTALYDIAAGLRMDYLPMRRLSNIEKKRSWVMVQDIDKQLYQRSLMRNLEKFVGGRHY
uniref:Copia protein n=1 Tax=Tanacetum cinerariifolium TaxID=118510 RepID=A0A6L2JHE1_TANCI|nr:copia protein [Tanacetum cinerariifolium]